MDNNNFIRYIFAIVVVVIICYTGYKLIKNSSNVENISLDQTSTVSNIQTDLRLAIAELDTINPILSNNRNVQEITKIIYDPLITLNENYKIEYCLAEEIAKTDDVTYVIKLKKGILWSDREEFSADDVKYTMDLICADNNINSVYYENLKYVIALEVLDNTTVKITLSQPVPFFEYNLTFPIMSAKYYNGEDFATSSKVPIGTGMFKIVDVQSNIIKLERNEYYWDTNRVPMVNEININLYNSIGEVYNAFKSGDIDIVTVKISNIQDYIGTLGYNKIEYKYRDYDFLSLNTTNDILSEQSVRKALSLIIDKNNIVASCLGSGYVPSNFSLDMGNWLYTRDLNISVDTEQAKQILIADGWNYVRNTWQKKIDGRTKTLGFRITVNNNNSNRIAVAENIKEQLQNFGISVQVIQLSPESYVNVIKDKNYDCILTGIEAGFSPNLNTFFGDNNLANYSNNEVFEIMNAVVNTSDENLLYEKYNRLYDIYLEEVPYIGLYRNTNTLICNQGLVGNITPNSFNVYHNIEKWYRQ